MCTEIQMPISSIPLVTVIMTKAKEISRVANLLLFYFVHKNIALKTVALFWNVYYRILFRGSNMSLESRSPQKFAYFSLCYYRL